MRASGSKIIIKPRRSRQPEPIQDPSPTPEFDPVDNTDHELDAVDDDDGPSGSELPADSQREDSEVEETFVDGEPKLSIRIRGRGRPPKGFGTLRPRGRPRGSGRGRGRPRGAKAGPTGPIMLRLPKRVEAEPTPEVPPTDPVEESVEPTPTPAPEDVEIVQPMGGGKPFRQVAGKVYIIENDELITDDDPKGDEKIDSNGNLLGGRQFKAQTFILPNRDPARKYMLAIDAARTSGFRDSLYYFRRNLLAFKLNATQAEKEYLIEAGKLGGHLRTRSVTLITARSAYKLHGAKMLLDGRLVIDDYYEDKALAEITEKGLNPGDPVSTLLDQQAQLNEAAALGLKNLAPVVEKGTKVGLYRMGGPTTIFGNSGWGPFSDGPLNVGRKALLNREGVNEENWMYIAAEKTMELNQDWTRARIHALRMSRANYAALMGEKDMFQDEKVMNDYARGKQPEHSEAPDVEMKDATNEAAATKKKKSSKKRNEDCIFGAYEAHTNLVQTRNDMQPTQSRLELLPDSPEAHRVLGGSKAGNGAWGVAWVDTVIELPKSDPSQPPPTPSILAIT